MVDLQGPIIETKGFRDGLVSIPLKAGHELRITCNKKLQGNERFVVWDYASSDKKDMFSLVDKLSIGANIFIDYGSV